MVAITYPAGWFDPPQTREHHPACPSLPGAWKPGPCACDELAYDEKICRGDRILDAMEDR